MARSTEPVIKRPDSPYYYAWVPDERTGRSVLRSTKCTTQGEAVAWRRRKLRAHQDPTGEAARSVTLEEVLNDFLESRANRRSAKGKPLSRETLAFYQAKASMVAAVLGAKTLASLVTASAIDEYIKVRRGHGVKDHSTSKELNAVLRPALQLAKRRNKWAGDLDTIFPATGDFSAGYDPKEGAKRALDRRDVARLHAVMKPHVFAVLAYGIAASAEMAALERARREDVAKDRSSIRVRGSKNERRDRVVPVTLLEQAWLLDFALAHARGVDVLFPSLSNIRRDFAKAAKAAGVHHFSPHNVRHTLAKWLTVGGVHSAVVGSVLGHADGRMVERTYGHLSEADDLRDAVLAQYRPVGFLGGKPVEDVTHGTDGTSPNQAKEPDPGAQGRNRTADTGIFNPPEDAHLAAENAASESGLLGSCAASDAALRLAVQAAVQAGQYERARLLLEILSDVSASRRYTP